MLATDENPLKVDNVHQAHPPGNDRKGKPSRTRRYITDASAAAGLQGSHFHGHVANVMRHLTQVQLVLPQRVPRDTMDARLEKRFKGSQAGTSVARAAT